MRTFLRFLPLFALAGLVAGWPVGARAAAHVVNVPGDFATLVAAANAISSDTIVNVAPGTYNEVDRIFLNDSYVTFTCTGVATVHCPNDKLALVEVDHYTRNIVFQNFVLERPTCDADWMRVVNEGTNCQATFINCDIKGPACGGGVICNFASDVSAYNCRFGPFNPIASWAGAIGFENGGWDTSWFSEVTLANCTFTGCNRWIACTGFAANGSESWAGYDIGKIDVRQCTFDLLNNDSGNFPGIFFLGQAQQLRWDKANEVLFEDCSFQGKKFVLWEMHYPGSVDFPSKVTLRRCTFKAYDGTAAMMYYDVASPTVWENVIVEGGKFEQIIHTGGAPQDWQFLYCTLANDGITAAESAHFIDSSSIITGYAPGGLYYFRNTIVYSPTNYSAAFHCDDGPGVRTYDMDYSIVDHATPTSGTRVQINGGAHYSNAHVAFADYTNRNLHLVYPSPGFDQGTVLPGIGFDVAMNPRVQGTGPDMGAFENTPPPAGVADWNLFN